MNRFLAKLVLVAFLVLIADRGAGSLLLWGLERYYGFDKSAGVLLVGHSHTMLGIDHEGLERSLGKPVAKYAVNGANVFDRLAMLRHYFSEYPGKVKLVVYDVDDRTFSGEGISSNSYRLFYPFIANPAMQAYLQANAGSWEEYQSRKFLWSLRFNAAVINLSLRGMRSEYGNFKSGTVNINALQEDIDAGRRPGIKVDPQHVKALDDTIQLVRSQGVKLVLCYIPTVDLLSSMDPARHQQVIGMFRRYADKDPEVLFLNYQPAFGSRYELFSDSVHLNKSGREIFTKTLQVDLINIFAGGQKSED